MARSEEWSNVSDALLEKEAVTELCEVLTPIEAKWDCFATQLGILPEKTDSIGRKNHYDPTLCLKDVLNTWLNGKYNIQIHGRQSWRRVCEATASSAGGENKRLAQEIAAQHQAEQTGTALNGLSPGSDEIDSAGPHIFNEKPKFPKKLIDDIQKECEPLKPSEDQHEAVKEFSATKVKVVIQSCNKAEYTAALEAIERPPLPMFDKPVRYPTDKFTIVVGTFAGKNAAIVRTKQGNKCRDNLTTVLSFFPNATMLLGLGVCMGIKHKFGDVLVGEKIQLEENPKVRQGKLQLDGTCKEAKQTVGTVFCDTTGWNYFECTDVPEGSDVNGRTAEAFSGCILSSPNLLDDPSIKHGLESVSQPLIGAEMEGWVLFKYIEKDFPNIETLIIKGICDYGDGTKKKEWQLTAAKAALDYARFKLEKAFLN